MDEIPLEMLKSLDIVELPVDICDKTGSALDHCGEESVELHRKTLDMGRYGQKLRHPDEAGSRATALWHQKDPIKWFGFFPCYLICFS